MIGIIRGDTACAPVCTAKLLRMLHSSIRVAVRSVPMERTPLLSVSPSPRTSGFCVSLPRRVLWSLGLLAPLPELTLTLFFLEEGSVLYIVSEPFAVDALHVVTVTCMAMPRPATGFALEGRERLST